MIQSQENPRSSQIPKEMSRYFIVIHEGSTFADMLDGRERKNIRVGQVVEIVLKKDQRTGVLTEGIVKGILTKASKHTHGIKVILETNQVGRVKHIIEDID